MTYSHILTYTSIYLIDINILLLYLYRRNIFQHRQKKNKLKNNNKTTTTKKAPFCQQHYLQNCSIDFSHLTPLSLWNVNTDALWGLSALKRYFSIAITLVSQRNNVNIQTTVSCKNQEKLCSHCAATDWILKWYCWVCWAPAHPQYLLIVFTQ